MLLQPWLTKRFAIFKFPWLLALPACLPLVAGLFFVLVIAIQARINQEYFPNQAADTLRAVIGSKHVNHFEYDFYIAKMRFRRWWGPHAGRLDPCRAACLARPLADNPDAITTGDRPPDITPLLVSPVMPGEGHWLPLKARGPGLWWTIVRPAATCAINPIKLVAMDTGKLELTFVPGMEVTHQSEASMIPLQARGTLVAVFNGGFRSRQKVTGQRKAGIQYHPLRAGMASIILGQAGARISTWDERTAALNPTADVRQNFDLLLENGLSRGTYLKKHRLDFPTFRTGLGLTTDRRWLVFAAGDDLQPNELALALRLASCATALHLDQNHGNVFFEVLDESSDGLQFRPIAPAVHFSKIEKCLHGSNRDFFYISLKRPEKLKIPSETAPAAF